MSRIGKKAIDVPKDVSIQLENSLITVKGKHGTLQRTILDILNVNQESNKLIITRKEDSKKSREYHGLMRALVQNMVSGVNEKFSKTLIAEGVGYKFQVDKNKLVVNAGFTHPVEFVIPSDLAIKVESPTKISIMGIDKEKVGFFSITNS
jgi:large subunit ribosomal protein L6